MTLALETDAGALLIALSLAIPLAAAFLIALTGDAPNQRETVTLLAAAALATTVASILPHVLAGETLRLDLLEPLPGVPIAFEVEPLGMIFAGVASSLWILNSIYSIGYMRANNEARQTRFYICFAIALASAIGIAFSANLFTLFIFYEALTLSTYPLVAHHEDEEARRGGRTYIGLLMATSIAGLLFAILWVWSATGTTAFTPGGILAGKVGESSGNVLLVLFMYGIGKAALMPFHRWLPAAMVAPTPVSALLHAVAVVKAGVFCVVKVAVYVFGLDYLGRLAAADLMLAIAAFTVLGASIVAMRQDNLKRRLAYSTVSQLSYVVIGAMLGNALGAIGGGLHIVMHAFGKITLFFCAGAIYTAAHRTEISTMNGLGRVMPITWACFFIGALSVIGLPPMGGSWSKFLLAVGAADAGQYVLIAVLMLSSLLNVVYLLGPVVRAFFQPGPEAEAGAKAGDGDGAAVAIHEAPLACVVPLAITAFGCLVLFFAADAIHDLLLPIAAAGP